ncbi:MAG: alpha/beta hydrolase family protein [Sphaerochaeta sp.]
MKLIQCAFVFVLMTGILSPLFSNGMEEQQMKLKTDDYPMGSILGDATSGAPELAYRGEYVIGYREIQVVNPSQIDVLSSTEDNVAPIYDRPITLGIWYPADVSEDTVQLCEYTDHYGRIDQGNLEPFTLMGRAVKEAEPLKSEGPFPLIVISHGYPGSLFIMSYLCENLATKGYVVVAIAHTDSTYEDASNFSSTLINRSLDQKFTIEKMDELSKQDGWLEGLLDASNVGLIGYSMGAYGTVRTLGGGMNDTVANLVGPLDYILKAAPNDKGNSNIKAAVLFAPWGAAFGDVSTLGIYDRTSMLKINTPTLWIDGTKDDIAGYEGVRGLYEASKNSDRYMLSYVNALHNCAPDAAPASSYSKNWDLTSRWADPTWDTRRMNNINMHFVTAFMDSYLKENFEKMSYFDVKVENAGDGVYSVNKDGTFKSDHTYWPGFPNRSVTGVILEHLEKENN